LDFLELDDDGRADFPIKNANKVHRSFWLANFTHHTPLPVARAWGLVKKVTGIRGLGLMDRVQKMNAKPVERVGVSPELRSELYETFKDDIALLGCRLNRDLSHWR
jgi:hypothetical protein